MSNTEDKRLKKEPFLFYGEYYNPTFNPNNLGLEIPRDILSKSWVVRSAIAENSQFIRDVKRNTTSEDRQYKDFLKATKESLLPFPPLPSKDVCDRQQEDFQSIKNHINRNRKKLTNHLNAKWQTWKIMDDRLEETSDTENTADGTNHNRHSASVSPPPRQVDTDDDSNIDSPVQPSLHGWSFVDRVDRPRSPPSPPPPPSRGRSPSRVPPVMRRPWDMPARIQDSTRHSSPRGTAATAPRRRGNDPLPPRRPPRGGTPRRYNDSPRQRSPLSSRNEQSPNRRAANSSDDGTPVTPRRRRRPSPPPPRNHPTPRQAPRGATPQGDRRHRQYRHHFGNYDLQLERETGERRHDALLQRQDALIASGERRQDALLGELRDSREAGEKRHYALLHRQDTLINALLPHLHPPSPRDTRRHGYSDGSPFGYVNNYRDDDYASDTSHRSHEIRRRNRAWNPSNSHFPEEEEMAESHEDEQVGYGSRRASIDEDRRLSAGVFRPSMETLTGSVHHPGWSHPPVSPVARGRGSRRKRRAETEAEMERPSTFQRTGENVPPRDADEDDGKPAARPMTFNADGGSEANLFR